MTGEREAGALADGLDRLLERLAGEGGQLAALLTDEVMVVVGGVDALVARGVAADVHPLDQPQPLEALEGAVDAGTTDRVDATVDLQRRQRAVGAGQQLDDLPSRATAAVSRFVKLRRCVCSPVQVREAIRE